METSERMDRRGFVRFGLTGVGVLAASPVWASIPRLFNPMPPTVPQSSIPIAPPQTPAAAPVYGFEIGSGVHPQLMTRAVQDYFAMTLSPEFAGRVPPLQAQPRQPVSFHTQFRSDYVVPQPMPPMLTRLGFYMSVQDVVRVDGQQAIRGYQDLNFFEMRRLIQQNEVAQFRTVLVPASLRQAPTQMDYEPYRRVARQLYGIPNPEASTLLYTRLFTDGRQSYMGFLAARGPDPMRSPYKDLLLDTTPF